MDTPGPLRLAIDSLAALWTCGGAKGLIRRLAWGLVHDFSVRSMAIATLTKEASTPILTPNCLGLTAVQEITGKELSEISSALRRLTIRDEELREGITYLQIKGKTFAIVGMEMGDGTDPFLIWETVPQWTRDQQELIELLIKAVQNEAKWYRQFDSTQDLIYRDDLTGLFNTRYLEIAIDSELKRAQRYKSPFSLLFIDLDGFKPINDQHGHVSGSAVLKQVAHVIRDVVREIDIPMRYGGDEFVVLLVGATTQTGLLVAERVRRRIADESFRLVGEGTVRLTCSIGVASYPDHGEDLGTLLKMADENMYISKKSGKNRVSIVNRRFQENAR